VVFTNPRISLPAFSGFEVSGNFLFPGLFITVACGAISGFHSLVAAGEAGKQIRNEKHMLPVSYGAMLVEALLAVLALIAVGSLARGGALPRGTPPFIFARAVSGFLHQLGLPARSSFTFVSLAVSSFVFTTLDTVARLGRLSLQELFAPEDGAPPKKRNLLSAGPGMLLRRKPAAALFTLFPAFLLAVTGYRNIWALFGAANQLLAALTLIACTLFFKKHGRNIIPLLFPAAAMLAVTFSSLILTVRKKFLLFGEGSFVIAVDGLQMAIACLLLVLGAMVTVSCARRLFRKDTEGGI
jgi:carbon starvation protein